MSCFHQQGDTLYSPGRCELGNFDIVATEGPISPNAEPLLYPNPVRDVTRVQLPDNSILQEDYFIYLHDVQGRLLTNWSVTGNELHLEQVARGIYFMSLKRRTDGKTVTLSLCKL